MSAPRVHVVIGDGAPLASVPAEAKRALVRAHGAVLFRGFTVDMDGFRQVARELGTQFYNMALDPKYREMLTPDGVVGGVLKGTSALPLHMERGYSPLRPELVLFHVVQPSRIGGESLLCSGARVLELLAPELVERFRTVRLLWRHTWEPEAWRGRYGATPDEVMQRLGAIDGVRDLHFAGELLHYTYAISAIQTSRLGGAPGFVNNLEGGWELMNASVDTRRARHEHVVLFEDGSPITQALIDDVHAAVVAATEVHAIAPADIVAIDNYRFMHGRRAFEGPRVMHTIMADASF